METVIERGCGLDVHKKSVAACVRVPGPKGTRESHVRTFGTMAAELAALREWLESQGGHPGGHGEHGGVLEARVGRARGVSRSRTPSTLSRLNLAHHLDR